MKKIKHFFTLLLFFPIITHAQVLLKDINTANSSSHPYSAFDLNGTTLFIANNQLWKTDGTAANTSIVVNPNQYPYNGPSFYNNLTKLKLNNEMFFATDGTNSSGSYVGRELWKTDGTTGGTTLVADIYSGNSSSDPELLTTAGNYMYFSAYSSTAGRELWSTDGTTVNFLGDINAGSNNSNSYYIDSYAALGTKMIFKAYDGTNGTELWITDGTQAGTLLLKDIYPGSNSSSISNLTTVGSKVYFSANNPTYGSELWVTDGTVAGTQMVLDIYSSSCLSCGSYPSNFRELNGSLIFSAQSSIYGTALWKSDGTAAGTVLLKNIYPASFTSSSPQDLTKSGNKIFFTAENGTVGRELWATDGTTAGTILVKDINLSNSVGDISFPLSSSQRKFINVNGVLFFIANSGIEGYELWKSDGTTAGTTLIKDFLPSTLSGGYSNFTVVGSKLYFIVEEDNGTKKLCVSDGTVAGSQALETLAPSLDMTNGYPLIGIGNTLLFVAYHSQYGYELYKTDGTLAGTSFLKDISTSTFYPSSFNLKASNNNATLFNFNNNKNGLELWRTDGSTAGTQEMINLNPYPISSIGSYYNYYSGSSSISQIVVFNNEFYISINGVIWKTDGINPPVIFRGYNGFSSSSSSGRMAVSNGKLFFNNPEDYELWATDGTEAGTYLVKEFAGGNNSFDPSQMIDINGTLFFRGYDSATGYELWKSDGTTAGTVLVKDITSGTNSTYFYDYVKVGNKLYFSNTTSSPNQLMVSDGTSAGTFSLLTANNSFNNLTNLNDNLLLFSFYDGGILYGNELWSSNGTVAGTTIVKDINAGTNSSGPYNYIDNKNQFAVYNGKAYFNAYDGSTNKLFVSDGTNAGTTAISSLSTSFIYPTPFGLYFSAYSNTYGSELYKSDGTAAGTNLVADINGGGNSSGPNNFYYNKNLLYFIATNATNGTEIFVIKLCDDNLNQTANVNGVQTYQVNNTIQATNTIEPNARVDYTAGKAILLNPGFKTDAPAGMFLAQINTCIYNPANAPLAPSMSNNTSNTSALLTETYLKDIKTIPSVNDFLNKSSNPNFLDLWNKTNEEKGVIEAEIRKIDKSTSEGQLKASRLTQQLNEYRHSVKFNKDKTGKIIAYILTLQARNQSESTVIIAE